MDELGAKVVGEPGQVLGQGDVEGLGAGWIGIALGGLGNGRAVDDGFGEGLQDDRSERSLIGQVEGAFLSQSGNGSGVGADQTDNVVAATGGGLGEGAAGKSGGAGEQNFHVRRTGETWGFSSFGRCSFSPTRGRSDEAAASVFKQRRKARLNRMIKGRVVR